MLSSQQNHFLLLQLERKMTDCPSQTRQPWKKHRRRRTEEWGSAAARAVSSRFFSTRACKTVKVLTTVRDSWSYHVWIWYFVHSWHPDLFPWNLKRVHKCCFLWPTHVLCHTWPKPTHLLCHTHSAIVTVILANFW